MGGGRRDTPLRVVSRMPQIALHSKNTCLWYDPRMRVCLSISGWTADNEVIRLRAQMAIGTRFVSRETALGRGHVRRTRVLIVFRF